jgi:hypothetical protein
MLQAESVSLPTVERQTPRPVLESHFPTFVSSMRTAALRRTTAQNIWRKIDWCLKLRFASWTTAHLLFCQFSIWYSETNINCPLRPTKLTTAVKTNIYLKERWDKMSRGAAGEQWPQYGQTKSPKACKSGGFSAEYNNLGFDRDTKSCTKILWDFVWRIARNGDFMNLGPGWSVLIQ